MRDFSFFATTSTIGHWLLPVRRQSFFLGTIHPDDVTTNCGNSITIVQLTQNIQRWTGIRLTEFLPS
jgi:hypothetical protein